MITVFFDMDGVLADFQRASLVLHGREDFPYTQLNWNYWDKLGLTAEQFWKPIDRQFWANLPRHEDGFRLLKRVEQAVPAENIVLLTSCASNEGCFDGKRDWLKTHLPQYLPRLFTGRQKGRIADPSKVLIDDSEDNIRDWFAGGGQPVMVPRPWNTRKYQCDGRGDFDVETVFENVLFNLRAATVGATNARHAA